MKFGERAKAQRLSLSLDMWDIRVIRHGNLHRHRDIASSVNLAARSSVGAEC